MNQKQNYTDQLYELVLLNFSIYCTLNDEIIRN